MDAETLSDGIPCQQLPERYVRPESERPRSPAICCVVFPVVDLGCGDYSRILEQIQSACKHYGFFQVINHGVSKAVIEEMMKVADKFSKLPMEEKLKLFSDDSSKTVRLSTTSLNVKKEEVGNWTDYVRLHWWPFGQHVPQQPSDPCSFKEIVSTYCTEMRQFGFRLEELISESLGLERDYLRKVRGEPGQHMAINYYPPCPWPELTYGSPGHTDLDLNAVTMLLEDLQASGLKVLKNGKWHSVKPQPDAFVISIGDELQAQLRTSMDRHDAAKKEIEPKLLELHQMLVDLAVKVQAQDKQIDNIEHNVISAFNCVQDGTKNLKRALRIIKAAVGAACVLGLLCFRLSWL